MTVTVVGAGLAGSEAAWQLAERGVSVRLCEQKPKTYSPAHTRSTFAELVCSNSLRSDRLENGVGLLKAEMRKMNSLIMRAADATRVPAGGALAVDRDAFSQSVTDAILNHPNIRVEEGEITAIPDGPCIIASGPLTQGALWDNIGAFLGSEYLYFYDAVAPIVREDTIDFEKAFWAARYDRGEADYINCPMSREEYQAFYEALITAECAPLHQFEKQLHFEGCMPVEELARRGEQTLLFGPLKPVGLKDPKTGKEPYGVVQLRQDNGEGTLFNIVGFQTHLKFGEQKRVFRMIPGLENAEFERYGVMHRNTYIHSPTQMRPTYQTQKREDLFFAGQITGVEGYVESAASGLVAGINAARLVSGQEPLTFPQETAHGAMAHYITHCVTKNFQPMNMTFGLLPSWPERIRDKAERYRRISNRALEMLDAFMVEKSI